MIAFTRLDGYIRITPGFFKFFLLYSNAVLIIYSIEGAGLMEGGWWVQRSNF